MLLGGRCHGLGLGLRFGLAFDDVAGQHLTQHHVRVGATEAEAGHTRHGISAVARPVGDGVQHAQMRGVEVDVGVGPGVVDRRRQLVMLQRQHHLAQAGRTGRRLHVSDIGFDGAEQKRLVGGTPAADHPAQRLSLDRVTQHGARAVRLDVVDGARVDAGIFVSPAQHVGLRIGVGRDQAVGPSVVVDRATGDHREDLVAVAARVVDPLEHQHRAALGAGVAVGVG